jgi:hypothetical protein
MTKPLLIAIAAGSLGVGFGIGYKVAEKRLATQFEDRLEKETAGMREFYQTIKKPYATPQEAAAALITEEEDPEPEDSTAQKANNLVAYHKIVKTEYVGEIEPKDELVLEKDPEPVVQNLFDSTAPELITQEEFMENESGFIQGVLTYYKVDEVLVDEREDPIEDQEDVIGKKHLQMFGKPSNGSSDPNVIHIRNPRLAMEFEVCLDSDSYTKKVLGLEEAPPDLPSGRKRS